MKRKTKLISAISFLLVIAMVVSFIPMTVGAAENGSARPIWIIGHRANNKGDVQKLLDKGANGIEIDIHCNDDGTKWVVNHDGYRPEFSLSLEQWFEQPALKDSRLTIVWFDIKSYKHLDKLHEYVQRCWKNDFNFRVIYSVDTLSHAKQCLPDLAKLLKPNETVTIDFENNVDDVYKYLNETLQVKNKWYANGITEWVKESGTKADALKKAQAMRDSDGSFCKVANWTLIKTSSIEDKLLNQTMDCIMTNGGGGDFDPFSEGVQNCAAVVREHPDKLRLATQSDNPFEVASNTNDRMLMMKVHTGNWAEGGTDAYINCQLVYTDGSSSKSFNLNDTSDHSNSFEKNNTDVCTFKVDNKPIRQIKIIMEKRSGLYPAWDLDWIEINGKRYNIHKSLVNNTDTAVVDCNSAITFFVQSQEERLTTLKNTES